MPAGLPTSCLTMAPRFDTLRYVQDHSRKALVEINGTGTVLYHLSKAQSEKADLLLT